MIIGWISSYADTNDVMELNIPWIDDDAPIATKLANVFRACNRVDGSSIEVEHANPSMSGGDIVFIDDQAYYCAPIGWCKITDERALDAYLDLPRRDRSFHAPEFDDEKMLIRNSYDSSNYKTLEPV